MKSRVEKLRAMFADLGIDGFLITSPSNRRYMTGFTGSAGVAIVSLDQAVFITDSRYVTQAKDQVKDHEIVSHSNNMIEVIGKAIVNMGITKLGFEQEDMSYGMFRAYRDFLPVQLVPASSTIEDMRVIKTEDEISVMKSAAQLTDETFTHILSMIQPGMSERQVANEIEYHMRKHGASATGFEFIIASGYRSALPHGRASDKQIQQGEMLTLDFGAYYNGYRSDMTRTIAIGDPGEELIAIYEIVLAAQLHCLSHIKAGVPCREIDKLTHDFIDAKGYGEYFGHGTGHGLGLDMHEEPFMARTDKVLQSGMVVTVEPGIYIPELGGVRIEDDVVITETGYELLTHSRKDLIIL